MPQIRDSPRLWGLAGVGVYFRFGAALMLVVLVSMAGVVMEKQTLQMRRDISRQYYQTDVLLDLRVSLRLQTQRLTSPTALAGISPTGAAAKPLPVLDRTGDLRSHGGRSGAGREAAQPRLPLLRFQQPFDPEGID